MYIIDPETGEPWAAALLDPETPEGIWSWGAESPWGDGTGTAHLWEDVAALHDAGVVNLPLYTRRIADAYYRASHNHGAGIRKPNHTMPKLSEQGWCRMFQELDAKYDTQPGTPLHHDGRCPIHGKAWTA